MITKEHSVKEWQITLDAFPKVTFRIGAETLDRALKILKADLGKALKEITPQKASKPTTPSDAGGL